MIELIEADKIVRLHIFQDPTWIWTNAHTRGSIHRQQLSDNLIAVIAEPQLDQGINHCLLVAQAASNYHFN